MKDLLCSLSDQLQWQKKRVSLVDQPLVTSHCISMLCAKRAEMVKLGKSVVQHTQTAPHAAAYHAFLQQA